MQVGASQTIETLFLHASVGNGSTSAVVDEDSLFTARTIPGVPLDNLLAHRSRPIRLIKINVEGYEYNSLLGAQRILSEDDPDIIFEFQGSGHVGITGKDFLRWLEVQGYSFINISGQRPIADTQTVEELLSDFHESMIDHLDVLAKHSRRWRRTFSGLFFDLPSNTTSTSGETSRNERYLGGTRPLNNPCKFRESDGQVRDPGLRCRPSLFPTLLNPLRVSKKQSLGRQLPAAFQRAAFDCSCAPLGSKTGRSGIVPSEQVALSLVCRRTRSSRSFLEAVCLYETRARNPATALSVDGGRIPKLENIRVSSTGPAPGLRSPAI